MRYPGKYFDSELWKKRRENAALYIQKIFKGILARKRGRLLNQKRNEIKLKKKVKFSLKGQ